MFVTLGRAAAAMVHALGGSSEGGGTYSVSPAVGALVRGLGGAAAPDGDFILREDATTLLREDDTEFLRE